MLQHVPVMRGPGAARTRELADQQKKTELNISQTVSSTASTEVPVLEPSFPAASPGMEIKNCGLKTGLLKAVEKKKKLKKDEKAAPAFT